MNFEPIDAYLKRVKQLSGKDMRLSFSEAQLLAVSIAELLSQLNQKAPAASASAPSVIDGGTFKDRNR